jgi:UDP-N-acetylmuramoyl-tripeptide--D-alanyl-D-alanine ligase
MGRFSASEVATWCAGCWNSDTPDAVISGFSKDSRTIQKDECYVALSGERHDGHDFIAAAKKRGASCAVVSEKYPGSAGLPILRVSDTCHALQDIASGYRRKVNPFVVGVTGSSGKTTVKDMIAACFRTSSKTASTRGNLNNHIGLPISLLEMEPDTEDAVLEIGMNHPGELRPLCDLLQPDWGVVTNVGPVHLENFESVEEIAREKSVMGEMSHECAFLDADSLFFETLSSACKCPIVTVSRSEGDYIYQLGETLKVLETQSGEEVAIRLPVPGLHIAYDAALSCAVARKKGIGWESIKESLSSYKPQPMRWEVQKAGGVTLINDAYNANPMSMRASIGAFLDGVDAKRKYLVLGDMLELGESSATEHRSLGAWLEGRDLSGLITVGALADEMAKVASSFCDVTSVSDSEKAGGPLKDLLREGDAVLFKASRGIRLEIAVSDVFEFLN